MIIVNYLCENDAGEINIRDYMEDNCVTWCIKCRETLYCYGLKNNGCSQQISVEKGGTYLQNTKIKMDKSSECHLICIIRITHLISAGDEKWKNIEKKERK